MLETPKTGFYFLLLEAIIKWPPVRQPLQVKVQSPATDKKDQELLYVYVYIHINNIIQYMYECKERKAEKGSTSESFEHETSGLLGLSQEG